MLNDGFLASFVLLTVGRHFPEPSKTVQGILEIDVLLAATMPAPLRWDHSTGTGSSVNVASDAKVVLD